MVLVLWGKQNKPTLKMMEGGFGFASVGTNAGGLRALVIGATGATGKSLVARLASMHEYSKVGTISRRSVDYEEADKVTQHIVDMATLDAHPEFFRNYDVLFCTLGTTRSAAGSAEKFVEVDRDYVATAAKMAKENGVKHFSLLTSGGNQTWPNLPPWLVNGIHPLLYAQTKYEAEQAVIAEQFDRTSIFQPGLLDRRVAGADERGMEKLLLAISFPATKVTDLANCMADEALREAQAFAPVTTYASSEIKKMIKAVTKLDLGKAGGIMKIDTNSIQIKDDRNPFGN